MTEFYQEQAQYWGQMMNAAIQAERVEFEKKRPSVIFRPTLKIDGNKWCALYGDNLQDGVAGFGDTPNEAMIDFDINWLNQKAVKEVA